MAHDPTRIPAALDILHEAEEYRALSADERAQLLVAACRAAAKILRSRPDAEIAANHVDPLPESTLRALARLRAEYRAARSPRAH